MWQTITAITVPLILGLASFLGGGGSRLSKKIHHHADLLDKLDGAPAASDALATLLAKEIRWLDAKESAKQARKINWRRVGEVVVATLGGVAATGAAFQVAAVLEQENDFWGSVASGAAAAIAGFSLFVIGLQATRIFEPKRLLLEELLLPVPIDRDADLHEQARRDVERAVVAEEATRKGGNSSGDQPAQEA